MKSSLQITYNRGQYPDHLYDCAWSYDRVQGTFLQEFDNLGFEFGPTFAGTFFGLDAQYYGVDPYYSGDTQAHLNTGLRGQYEWGTSSKDSALQLINPLVPYAEIGVGLKLPSDGSPDVQWGPYMELGLRLFFIGNEDFRIGPELGFSGVLYAETGLVTYLGFSIKFRPSLLGSNGNG